MKMKNAILVYPYKARIGYWSAQREIEIPSGTMLRRADNLPAGSDIYWWVESLPPELAENEEVESWHRCYGIGLGGDAAFLPDIIE
jgi:hypothetical protein